jgi:hypothetical protein
MNAALSISRLLQVTGLRPRVGSWVLRPLLCVIFATSAIHFLSGFPSVPLIGAGGMCGVRIAAVILLYLLCLFLTENGLFFYKKRPHP